MTTRDTRALAVAAAVVALLAVYAVRSADADLWGHLRYGKHVVENGGRVGTDPFAYTTSRQVWNDHEYLAQVALWYAYAAAGPVGLILLKCVLGAATVYVFYLLLRLGTDDVGVWVPLLILLAAGLGRWLAFRPQLFTFLLMAVFVLVLFRHLLGRRAHLWLLPPLVALWVNLHGGFLAGIGAVGLALLLRACQAVSRHGFRWRELLRETRPLALTLVGCFAGSLLNPLGWRLWPYLRTELGFAENRVYIQEWQPVWQVWGLWPALVPFFALLAVLLVAGLLAWRERVADLPGRAWLLSCVPLTLMALQSNRHIPVQIIWLAPVVAMLAGRFTLGWRRGLAAIAVIVGVLGVLPVLLDPRPRIVVGPSAFGATRPDRVVAFMKENGLRGNVYTPLWWGSYLTWELHPNVLVSADGRNVTLFSRDTVTANFRFYSEARPDADIPIDCGSDFVLVPTDTPGLPAVRADRRWAVLYEDAYAVLFVGAGNGELLGKRERGEMKNSAGKVAEFFR